MPRGQRCALPTGPTPSAARTKLQSFTDTTSTHPVRWSTRTELSGNSTGSNVRHGGDPQAWLTEVLGRIADHKSTRIDELLPWRYAAVAA